MSVAVALAMASLGGIFMSMATGLGVEVSVTIRTYRPILFILLGVLILES